MIEKERKLLWRIETRASQYTTFFNESGKKCCRHSESTRSHPLEKRNGQKRVPLVLCTSKTEVHIKSFFFLKEIAAIDKIPYRERKTKDQRTLSPKISPPVQRKK